MRTALAFAAAAMLVAASAPDRSLLEKARQFFAPLPADLATPDCPTTPARVALGRKLFFDSRLSLDGTVSCATCHHPALYGTDGLPTSIGVEHRANARNAPTVLNAALQFRAHWLGDRANVEEQAMKSLVGPASFGNPDFAAVTRKIKAIPGYAAEFAATFPQDAEPVTPANWGRAIGAYERTLVTPSPFDAFLKGDAGALAARADRGLGDFLDLGCAGCHNGVGVGGRSFQKFGIAADYWPATHSAKVDEGRFAITKDAADKYVFKVPSLRNVAMTPPYFHDGSVAALPDAVRVMAKVQLDKILAEPQLDDLLAFLNSLTGELPKDFATEPVLAPQTFSANP
jgi:cytochrome c peroxidase